MFEDSPHENPALTIHNLVFQEDDKKRKLVVDQLKDFTTLRMKQMGYDPNWKANQLRKM